MAFLLLIFLAFFEAPDRNRNMFALSFFFFCSCSDWSKRSSSFSTCSASLLDSGLELFVVECDAVEGREVVPHLPFLPPPRRPFREDIPIEVAGRSAGAVLPFSIHL